MYRCNQAADDEPLSLLNFKKFIRERDGFRCVDCGKSNRSHLRKHGRQLEVHRLIPNVPYTRQHSVTVCRLCHRRRHAALRRI